MARALKVYRTAIGFHDAYVATPTKKAALEAWGADRNLFASGRAELVTDPALTRAPLADPGKVIKVLRGTAAEQFAALGKDTKPRARGVRADPPPPRPAPRPSRAALDRAEKALAAGEARHERAIEKLERREAELRAQRRALQQERDRDLAPLREAVDHASEEYEDKMRAWRG